MKLERVEIENYRAIEKLDLPLHPGLTVLHGDNAHGKTSVLSAIATGLGSIPTILPDVSGIGIRKTDRRGLRQLWVALTAINGVQWSRQMGGPRRRAANQDLKQAMDAIVNADREESKPLDLPIVAFYDTDRAVFDQPQRRRGFKTEFPRYAALQGALAARTDFRDFFKWFYAKENEELRLQKERLDFRYQLKDLNAVRTAIESMVPGVSNPRVELRPLRFVVSIKPEDGKPEELSIDQLSGGYRIMLALAADLARRMAQGNPHLDDPLQSGAIVLIDEIELHLHPSWQQRILIDLARTFPNAQFIVSTHSPQVLTTVKPEHIIELRREAGEIVAGATSAPTYGAEAGDVLATVMGVDERPDQNDFVKQLTRYTGLVAEGNGESPNAVRMRQSLNKLSPHDPALDRSDIPQSDTQQGSARALDTENMMACCKGGTWKIDDDVRWKMPVNRNLSCGGAKANVSDPYFVDPRMLPALPSLTLVRFNGEITADETACANALIDTNRVNRTIKILGLNIPRLRIAREKHWDYLSNSWQEYYDNLEVMTDAARGELSLLNGGDLPRFFTTSRSYFARHGEDILEEQPQEWI